MIEIKKFKIEEMPHFSVGNKFYDLEIENKIGLPEKEVFNYIKDFIGRDKKVAEELLELPMLQKIIISYYGEKLWEAIKTYLISLM